MVKSLVISDFAELPQCFTENYVWFIDIATTYDCVEIGFSEQLGGYSLDEGKKITGL